MIVVEVEGGPEVRLLDARPSGLTEAGLRHWAREVTAASGAPRVARSYRYPHSAVAWHSEAVGIDIERIEACEPEFAHSICTPEERVDLWRAADLDVHVASLWAGKEALAKALGEPMRYDPQRLESPMRWRESRSGPWRAAQLSAPEDHIIWLCWRAADQEEG